MNKKRIMICMLSLLLTGCTGKNTAIEKSGVVEEVTVETSGEELGETEENSEEGIGTQTEERKEFILSEYEYNEEAEEITDEDLTIEYSGFKITPFTTIEEVVEALGYPEDYESNNEGKILYKDEYRWQLIYPSYGAIYISEIIPIIRVIMVSVSPLHDEQRDDRLDGYIDFLAIRNHNISRGVTLEDPVSEVLAVYGKPDRIEPYSADKKYTQIVYEGENGEIIMCLDESNTKVHFLMIDYYGTGQ